MSKSFEAQNSVEEMTLWRRQFHRFPETGFQVEKTADFVAEKLNSLGLDVHTGVGKTGVVAVLKKGTSEKSIGLRADMDALEVKELNQFEHRSQHEGKMHACGHDGHTAMLLGAAQKLVTAIEFDGTVNFIFQPNEEHGLGANAMIDDGLFERFPMQVVYGMHNMPGMPAGSMAMKSGPIMAGEDNFSITISGRGGHASLPHQHIDPLPIAAQIILALQTIVSRSIDPKDIAVVSVTEIITDGTTNVIPSTVRLLGDCRNFDSGVSTTIEKTMSRMVNGICSAHGANCEVVYKKVFPATINYPAETENAVKAALATVGVESVNTSIEAKTISEDFANMLEHKPGCYVFIGNGINSEGGCMLHNPHYDFNDEILAIGRDYWVNLVAQQLPCK